uniref:Uncharacterized protein n=1 Tax=Opuntia streptacantha TaxID=393608 RepID=A0A7C9E6G0_OPUST
MNIYSIFIIFFYFLYSTNRASPAKNFHPSSFYFDSDKPNTLIELTQIIDPNAWLGFYSKEKNRAAQVTHLERSLKDYVVRLDRINPFRINFRLFVHLRVLPPSKLPQLLFYPQTQFRRLVRQ